MATQIYPIYEFGDFQLDARERRLFRGGQAIPLHGKAFELLLALVRHRGKLLTKDEILDLVWPDQIVEEANLTVNMSAIRRALGERATSPRFITTISGRGYRFTGEVRKVADQSLTIERESFARLTVEQEEFDSPAPPATTAVAKSHAGWRSRSNLLLLCLASLVIMAGVAGASPWLYRSLSHSTSSSGFGSRALVLSRFSTHGGAPFRAVISPDGKSIVYTQRVNGQWSLWLGQVESNSSVSINEQPGIRVEAVAFSPDGGSLYLTIRDLQSAESKLVRMPVLGGVMTDVAHQVDSVVTFSADARRIAFLRTNDDARQTAIVVADADGKNERNLTTRQWPHNFSGAGLSWSPDGKMIAVAAAEGESGRQELLAVSSVDGSATRIGSRDWGSLGNVVWSPDGAGVIAVVRDNSTTRKSEIWFIPNPSGEPRKLTDGMNSYQNEALSVSRDGTVVLLRGHFTSDIWVTPTDANGPAKLALQGIEPGYEGADGLAWTREGRMLYTAYVGEGESILEMNSDGSGMRQLTNNVGDAIDRRIVATADGRYLVFQSTRSGSLQLWRTNADGSNLKQLTSGGSNSQPSISPDGQTVVYVSEDDGHSSLRRISIEGGESIKLADKRVYGPQVSPDGTSIAYFESLPSGLRLVIVPFNGGEASHAFSLSPIVTQASHLHWTADGTAIIYKDSPLGLWRQRLDGSPREPVRGLETVPVYNFALSVDGKSLAYTRGVDMREIVLLRNAK